MVLCCTGATKDMGKMLGGEEEKDPDAQKKEEERQEALRQQEEERKAKHARMEAEREKVRQQIRDKVGTRFPCAHPCPRHPAWGWDREPAWPGRRAARGGGDGHGAQHPLPALLRACVLAVRAEEEGGEGGGGESRAGAAV